MLLEKARAMFPEYGGDDSPYALLAAAYEKKGDKRKQADVLAKWTTLDRDEREGAAASSRSCSSRSATRRARPMRSRARCSSIRSTWRCTSGWPMLAKAAGDKQKVVRERAAIVALDPVDRADALYQLALAQHEAGDAAKARNERAARARGCAELREGPDVAAHAVRGAQAARPMHREGAMKLLAAGLASSLRRVRERRRAADAQSGASGMQRYFGNANEFYEPPDFRGNNPYDGRVTFVRIKYRGYAHMTHRGPGLGARLSVRRDATS